MTAQTRTASSSSRFSRVGCYHSILFFKKYRGVRHTAPHLFEETHMSIVSWPRPVAAVTLMLCMSAAFAQSSPVKPIRLVVGFTHSGGVDINARLLGPKLTEYLGQQVIVENRPGAGTNNAQTD